MTLTKKLPTRADIASTAVFLASDHVAAIPGTVANLTGDSLPPWPCPARAGQGKMHMSTQHAAPSLGRADLTLATLFPGTFGLGSAELLVVGQQDLIAAARGPAGRGPPVPGSYPRR